MANPSYISPLFVLPGIYGEKTELSEFRSRLLDRVPVEIIGLESIQEPLADLTDMKAIGEAVAREISRHSPEGFLRLAGYSFGGSVAFEAARYLIDSGRGLRFLGIIDVLGPRPEADNVQESRWGKRIIRLTRKISAGGHGGVSGLAYRAIRELLGRFCSSDSRLRRVLATVHRFWSSREEFVRRMLLYHFRRRAMENWRPTPIRGPVFLAISEENLSAIDQWNSLCPQARTIQLPGKHGNVLKPPSLEILLAEFANSVQDADVSEAQLSVPGVFPR